MKIAKAIVGGVLAGLGVVATALGTGHLTYQDGVSALIVGLTAFGGIYFVPNKVA